MKNFRDLKNQIHETVNKIDILDQVNTTFDQMGEARRDGDLASVSHLTEKAAKLIDDNFDEFDPIHTELAAHKDDTKYAGYRNLAKLKFRNVLIGEVFRHGGSWFQKVRMKEFVNVDTTQRHFATIDMPDFYVSIDESDRQGEIRFGWVSEDILLREGKGHILVRQTGKIGVKGKVYSSEPDNVYATRPAAQKEADKRNRLLNKHEEPWKVLSRTPAIVTGKDFKFHKNVDEHDHGAHANAVGTAPGNIAGVSDNDPPVDNRKKRKPTHVQRRKRPVAESCDTFAGCNVFDVDADTFQNCRLGRLKYSRWNKYLDDSTDVGANIKKYSQRNPTNSVILRDEKTKVMMYLQKSSNG